MLTAAWLIYVGMQLVQRYKVRFDSWFVFGISLIAFYSFAVLRGNVYLNLNDFDDIISLTASSLSALYVVCFISKRCKGWFAKVMAWIGRDSFYIMGLHLLTFKLGSLAMNVLCGTSLNCAELTAPAHNLLLYIYYAVVGVVMPLAIIWLWRRVRVFVFSSMSRMA